jgi:hypothetical protein
MLSYFHTFRVVATLIMLVAASVAHSTAPLWETSAARQSPPNYVVNIPSMEHNYYYDSYSRDLREKYLQMFAAFPALRAFSFSAGGLIPGTLAERPFHIP